MDMETIKAKPWHGQMDRAVALTVLVAALGYFVDVFDLLLFSIVRVQSLRDLGVPDDDLMSTGISLINTQMAGLLIGGIVWGVAGDKFGRLSVLFGSIVLYSLANIANGFASSVEQYAVLRFIAGLGLAGELGAGVTLASELLPKAWRGLGTTFIATIGVLGASAAAIVAEFTDWRAAYIIGGVLGLALLVMRINIRESGLYLKMTDAVQGAGRGDFFAFFRNFDLLRRYLMVILIGAPTWAMIGLFITLTPEFAKDFGMTEIPKAGTAVLVCYIGLAFGDMLSGIMSQMLRSRRKSVAISLCLLILFALVYAFTPHGSLTAYYVTCFLLGIGGGYWAMFIQMGAEQFGTNIRATAATSIPNVVRGLTIPITLGFKALAPLTGVTGAGLAVLGVAIALAFLALRKLEETFDTDLDYVENLKRAPQAANG